MLRSLPRAAPSLRGLPIRTALRTPNTSVPACTAELRHQQTRAASAHAISNPTLAQIEKRWDGMPPEEQADLWMALRDRMKNDWHELTLQERKAGMCTTRSRSWQHQTHLQFTYHTVLTSQPFFFSTSHQAVNSQSFFKSKQNADQKTCFSLLDCIRSPRPPSPPPSRRKLDHLRLHNARRRHLLRDLLAHTDASTPSPKNHERAISKDDERISEGAFVLAVAASDPSRAKPTNFLPTLIFLVQTPSWNTLTLLASLEPKHRASHRCLIRRLRREGHGAEQAAEGRVAQGRRRIDRILGFQ